MKTLLTFTGYHDPYSVGLIGDEEQPGPILSLLAAEAFEKVILFATPNTADQTAGTEEALRQRHEGLEVEVRDLPLEDPTDYLAILRELRAHLEQIQAQDPHLDAAVSVASGTPHMHACWLMLVASGEIPARILNVRPPRFVTSEKPLVAELDPTAPGFPEMRRARQPEPERPGAGFAARAMRPSTRPQAEPAGAPMEKAAGEVLGELPLEVLCGPLTEPEVDVARAMREMGLVADHPLMGKAVEHAALMADRDVTILIQGDTGTGKEMIARLIHRLSGREGRFVTVNCAAIPDQLFESWMFGHKKGSFTGAVRDQKGKFEIAGGGTLLLDEVGELDAPMQAKLLRVLQDRIIEPIGADRGREVDVRILAATNRDLKAAVAEKDFREDLYYRLCVGVIVLPPLHKRASDTPKIALHVLDRLNASLRRPKRLSKAALKRLQAHNWPGNVRELMNVIERSVSLCRHEVLEADDLIMEPGALGPDPMSGLPVPHEGFLLDDFLKQARKHLMLLALEQTGGNQSEAARLLGLSAQAVHKFVKSNR